MVLIACKVYMYMWSGFPKSERPAMLKEGNRHRQTVLIMIACSSARVLWGVGISRATVGDLNGPEEHRWPGAWWPGRANRVWHVRKGVVWQFTRQFTQVGCSPHLFPAREGYLSCGHHPLRRRTRYGCHSGESHC